MESWTDCVAPPDSTQAVNSVCLRVAAGGRCVTVLSDYSTLAQCNVLYIWIWGLSCTFNKWDREAVLGARVHRFCDWRTRSHTNVNTQEKGKLPPQFPLSVCSSWLPVSIVRATVVCVCVRARTHWREKGVCLPFCSSVGNTRTR